MRLPNLKKENLKKQKEKGFVDEDIWNKIIECFFLKDNNAFENVGPDIFIILLVLKFSRFKYSTKLILTLN